MKKIREIIQRVSYILDSRERRKLLPLVVLTLIGSAFELIGVTVFMPLIQIIMQPDSVIKTIARRQPLRVAVLFTSQ